MNIKGSVGTLLQTSGSMGKPKEIFHTLEQHILSAQAVIQNTGLDDSSVSLISLPLNHVSGLAILVRAWCSGGRWVMPPKGWTPNWALLTHGTTHLSLVATQLWRFMQDPEQVKALRRMKAILLGGSAVPKTLLEKAYAENLPVIMTYGCTETASQVTATRLGDPLDRLLTSGRCLADRQIEISETGEIVVYGDMISGSRQFFTGDLGFFDPQGYLHVLGRQDNRLISGGENIYPEEIERTLLEHIGVERALVIALEDVEFGQRPAALIKMHPGFDLQVRELEAFLRERIERFKIPKKWAPWPEDWPADKKPNRMLFAKYLKQ